MAIVMIIDVYRNDHGNDTGKSSPP